MILYRVCDTFTWHIRSPCYRKYGRGEIKSRGQGLLDANGGRGVHLWCDKHIPLFLCDSRSHWADTMLGLRHVGAEGVDDTEQSFVLISRPMGLPRSRIYLWMRRKLPPPPKAQSQTSLPSFLYPARFSAVTIFYGIVTCLQMLTDNAHEYDAQYSFVMKSCLSTTYF
jgi:hypothetical protein